MRAQATTIALLLSMFAPMRARAEGPDPCRPTSLPLSAFMPLILDSQLHLVANPLLARALLPQTGETAPTPSLPFAPVHDPADDIQDPAPSTAEAPPTGAEAPHAKPKSASPRTRLAPLQPLPEAPAQPRPVPQNFQVLPEAGDSGGFSFSF